MPSETLFIKANHDLWTLDVGLSRWNEIRLIRFLPFHEKHQLSRRVCRPDDLLRIETSIKSSQLGTSCLLEKRHAIS